MDTHQLTTQAVARIEELLRAKKWSRAELGRRTDIDAPHITRLMKAEKPTSLDTLAKVAAALGVTVAFLLGGSHKAGDEYRLPKIGRTAASMAGIDPQTEADDWLHVHTLYKGEAWAVEVFGESMIDANICEGDHVIVRRQPAADLGEVVLAWVGDSHDGGFTLKKLARRTDRATGRTVLSLVPRNKSMETEFIPLDGSVPYHIFGVYQGLIRRADEEGVPKRRGKGKPAPKGKK